jgi:hypothetical protein
VENDPRGRAVVRYAAVYTFLMTLVLATGEIAALHVIAYDYVWSGARLLVGASLAIGALGIIVPIGIQQFNTWTRLRRRQIRAATGQSSKDPDEAPVKNVPLAAVITVSTAVVGVVVVSPAVSWLVDLLLQLFDSVWPN